MSDESMQCVQEIMENEELRERVIQLEGELEGMREQLAETRLQRDALAHERDKLVGQNNNLRKQMQKDRKGYEKGLRKARGKKLRELKKPVVLLLLSFGILALMEMGVNRQVLDPTVGESVALASGMAVAFFCGQLSDRIRDTWQTGKVGVKP